jgi:hypothetical protein
MCVCVCVCVCVCELSEAGREEDACCDECGAGAG